MIIHHIPLNTVEITVFEQSYPSLHYVLWLLNQTINITSYRLLSKRSYCQNCGIIRLVIGERILEDSLVGKNLLLGGAKSFF